MHFLAARAILADANRTLPFPSPEYGNTIEIGSGAGPRTYFKFGDAGTLRNHWISD
jgi:hypothetical protein